MPSSYKTGVPQTWDVPPGWPNGPPPTGGIPLFPPDTPYDAALAADLAAAAAVAVSDHGSMATTATGAAQSRAAAVTVEADTKALPTLPQLQPGGPQASKTLVNTVVQYIQKNL